MNTKWRRYAPWGLYLTLAALLAAVVLYIIQREWNLYLQISLALAVAGLAVNVLLDPDGARLALTGRQARYGSNALILSLAVVGILVVVNYLVYQNSQRWDLTEDQQNTLAPETIDTLANLQAEVQAQAFFTARINSQGARGLLDQYKFNSKGKFDFTFIDPEADPIAAQQANITRDGTIVLRMGDRLETVTLVSEQELTGSLVRLMGQGSLGVYFLTGHGERNPGGSGDDSYSQVKSTLESKGYKVEQLNLLADRKIPDDAKVVVVAGPTRPITDEEILLLDDFVKQRGSLVVMEEPLPVTQFGEQVDPLAKYLDETWGILLGSDMVVDVSSNSPFVAFAGSYANHAITQKMQGLGSYFPTARSVLLSREIPENTRLELVMTSEQAWAESDLAAITAQQEIGPTEGETVGNVSVAVISENSTTNQNRVVVIGDSDFATDVNFVRLGNSDLFINLIDWAAEQENLINLTPKDATQRVLVPAQRYTIGLLLFSSVFLLPGLVLVAGITVWIQRRRRG